MAKSIRRRDVISLTAGAAAWPLAARAQQSSRIRRIGVLLGLSDPVWKSYLDTFVQELARLGWVEGRNVRIDRRFGGTDLARTQMLAKELVQLSPDAILTDGTPNTAALQQETRTIPIVFTVVVDPVSAGFVAGLPRPGGNITGFIIYEPTMVGKWLQMIKEIAPEIRRVVAMFHPDSAFPKYMVPTFEAAARALMVDAIVAEVRSDAEIELAIELLGREQGGLVVFSDVFTLDHRATIISAATRNKVPTIAQPDYYARDGGLLSYGPDNADNLRRAAGYVDRILNGEKPADLPVQIPTRFNLVINLKAAKALGLNIPPTLLVFANEVIE